MELHHQHFAAAGRSRGEFAARSGQRTGFESYFESMISVKDETERRAILESMMQAGDTLLAARAQNRIAASNGREQLR